MEDIECWQCKWALYVNNCHWCMLAREKIHDPFRITCCDFYREDGYDDLYDNDALDRDIKKNDQSVHNQE